MDGIMSLGERCVPLLLSPFPNVIFRSSAIRHCRHLEQGCTLNHTQCRAAQSTRLRCSAQGEYDCSLASSAPEKYVPAPVCAYYMLAIAVWMRCLTGRYDAKLAHPGAGVRGERRVAAVPRKLARLTRKIDQAVRGQWGSGTWSDHRVNASLISPLPLQCCKPMLRGPRTM